MSAMTLGVAGGGGPEAIASDGTSIWVTTVFGGSVTQLRPGDGARLGTYTAGRGPFGVAFDGRHIWVTNVGGGSISTTLAP